MWGYSAQTVGKQNMNSDQHCRTYMQTKSQSLPPPHNNVEILRMAKRGTYSPDDSARRILAPAAVLRRQLGPAHDIERRAYQNQYSPPVKMSNMLKHSPPIRCSVFTIWIIAAGPPSLIFSPRTKGGSGWLAGSLV